MDLGGDAFGILKTSQSAYRSNVSRTSKDGMGVSSSSSSSSSSSNSSFTSDAGEFSFNDLDSCTGSLDRLAGYSAFRQDFARHALASAKVLGDMYSILYYVLSILSFVRTLCNYTHTHYVYNICI